MNWNDDWRDELKTVDYGGGAEMDTLSNSCVGMYSYIRFSYFASKTNS